MTARGETVWAIVVLAVAVAVVFCGVYVATEQAMDGSRRVVSEWTREDWRDCFYGAFAFLILMRLGDIVDELRKLNRGTR